MKTIKILTIILVIVCNAAFAQNTEDAKALVKEGVQLNDRGKYAEAIEKYNQALKIDPGNIYADFEMAYSLFASGKGDEGIPHLQKVIAANTSLSAGAYDLLGSIYDKDNKKDKAIEAYMAGIKDNPTYQRLYYNPGIVYFRYKQYAEAEKYAIEAIKLDPKHASSQRMYALVNFHQNKRVPALLAFCSFILLEPNTARTTEAFNNIQHILQGGALNNGGRTTIMLSPKDNTETSTQNLSISVSAISGQQRKLAGTELLEYELKAIFTLNGELSEKKTDKGFFDKFFAEYFYKLAQSNNMPAFTRAINPGASENTAWIAGHPQYMNDLYEWVKTTERAL